MRPRLLLALGLSLAAVLPLSASAEGKDAPQEIRIALVDTFQPDFYLNTVVPLFFYFKKTLPQYRFKPIEVRSSEIPEKLSEAKPHFLISSAGNFVTLIKEGAQQIVTRKSADASNVKESVGASIVVKDSRKDLQTLGDLKGKRAAVSEPSDFAAWHTTLFELAKNGFDPDKFFSSVQFTENKFPDGISLLKSGKADALVLPLCALEEAQESGRIQKGELRVVNAKAGGRCARSTDLFPDAVFSSMPEVEPKLLKEITLALLNMPSSESSFEWVPLNDFVPVLDLQKALKIGNYAYLRDKSLKDFLIEYRNYFYAAFALLLLLIAHSVRANVLVRRRTSELKAEQGAKEAVLAESRKSRSRLEALERSRIVSEFSRIFAHELKQPLASVLFSAKCIDMLLKKESSAKPEIASLLSDLMSQSVSAADLIDNIRRYTRKPSSVKEPCVLSDIARKALASLHPEEKSSVSVSMAITPELKVLGDPFELELVFLNLLKNAFEAVEKEPDPLILIEAQAKDGKVSVAVEDNGPEIPEENFKALGTPVVSQKEESLGIGLSIVSSIIERLGSRLVFEQIKPHGLKIRFELPEAPDGK